MCSEFGNWGLPDPERLADAAGNEPWWFETGHDWGEGVMYAHGVRTALPIGVSHACSVT